jgi:hypothetical protein
MSLLETLGPYAAPPLNKDWLHICIPGYARQTRFEWLDPESQAGIKAVAKFIVDEAKVHGFPIRRLGVKELQAAHAPGATPAIGGIVDHWTVSRAFGQTDHTDVGPMFPWDILELELAGLLLPPQPPTAPPTMPIPSLPAGSTPSEEESVFTHLLTTGITATATTTTGVAMSTCSTTKTTECGPATATTLATICK